MIYSVLSSLPLYFFLFFKVPKKVLGEIMKLHRRFLWGGDENSPKMAWVSCDLVRSSKCIGGLGKALRGLQFGFTI